MVSGPPDLPLLLLEAEGGAPFCFPFLGGGVFLYSAPAPDKVRPNEDAAAVVPWGASRGVLAVADGLGGQPRAEQAAEILARALGSLDGEGAGSGGPEPFGEAILRALEDANRRILDLGVGAGTTLALAELSPEGVRAHHVGDSMVALVDRAGLIKLRTVPHSPVGYALEAGLLTEEEALDHPDRHVISNMVGSAAMRPERSQLVPWERGDTLLVASDGLTDNLLTDEWIALLKGAPVNLAGESLVRLATERMHRGGDTMAGKPDDLTLLLYRRD